MASDENPAPHPADRSAARAALLRMRARARTLKAAGFDWETVKADRDAGRPGVERWKDPEERDPASAAG